MIKEEIHHFLTYLGVEKRYALNTIVSYKNDLNGFSRYLAIAYNGLPLSDISHGIVRSWIVDLMDKGMTPKSINRKISSLKSFFNYLTRLQKVDRNPMRKIVAPKVGKRLPQYVKEQQMETLLESDDDVLSFSSVRNKIIIELFYISGMRRIELIELTDHSINEESEAIKVIGKGNKERIIPVGRDFIYKLKNYIQIRNEHFEQTAFPRLFVSDKGKSMYPKLVYNIVKSALNRVSSSEKKSPHILRHSFATHLTNNGADLNAVKELLGHASLAATQVYTHNSIDKLKEIYKKAHPKG